MRTFLTLGIFLFNLMLMAQVGPPPPPPPNQQDYEQKEISGYKDKAKLPNTFLKLRGSEDFYRVIMTQGYAIYSRKKDKRLFPGLFSDIEYLGKHVSGNEMFRVTVGRKQGIVFDTGKYLVPLGYEKIILLAYGKGFITINGGDSLVFNANGKRVEGCNLESLGSSIDSGRYVLLQEEVLGFRYAYGLYDNSDCAWFYLKGKVGRRVNANFTRSYALVNDQKSIVFDDENRMINILEELKIIQVLSEQYYVGTRNGILSVYDEVGNKIFNPGAYQEIGLGPSAIYEYRVVRGFEVKQKGTNLKSFYLLDGTKIIQEATHLKVIDDKAGLLWAMSLSGLGRVVNLETGGSTEEIYVKTELQTVGEQDYHFAYKYLGFDVLNKNLEVVFSADCGRLDNLGSYSKYLIHYVADGFRLLDPSFMPLSASTYARREYVLQDGGTPIINDTRIDQDMFRRLVSAYFVKRDGEVDLLLRDGVLKSLEAYLIDNQ